MKKNSNVKMRRGMVLKHTTCPAMQTQARLQRVVSFANRIRVYLKKVGSLNY